MTWRRTQICRRNSEFLGRKKKKKDGAIVDGRGQPVPDHGREHEHESKNLLIFLETSLLWENYHGAVSGEVIKEGFWGSSLGGVAGWAYSSAPSTGSRVLTNGFKNKARALCK